MTIIGIDPGPAQSAYVFWNDVNSTLLHHGILGNNTLLSMLREYEHLRSLAPVIEMIQSFGMPVGKEIFETVLMVGRLIEIFDCKYGNYNLVYRKDIKIHFCGTARAKDGNIRQALIDRYGAPGTKKKPGVLYGVSKDVWSALACAIWYADKTKGR